MIVDAPCAQSSFHLATGKSIFSTFHASRDPIRMGCKRHVDTHDMCFKKTLSFVYVNAHRASLEPHGRTPPRPLNISKIGVFFDCHGVLDKSVDQSQQLIQSLREKYPALRLYCLSFAPSDWRQRQVSDFCEELDLECLLTVEKFGQRGKRACLATVAERDNLQFAFFLDDQDYLARDVGRLGSWVTTRVLCENESILVAEAPIAAFIAQCREKLHRPDVRDRDQI